MGIFTRFSDIVNSNINAILDKAEDPEKIVRLMIQEMEDTLVEVRTTAARTIAEKKELGRKRERLAAALEEWTRKAELALGKDREDLAKAALLEKAKLAETARVLDEELEAIEAELDHQDRDIARLQAKLDEAKAKQKALVARQQTVGSRLRIRRQLYNGKIDEALNRMEQVERKLDQTAGEVEAFDLGQRKTLAEEIAELETEPAIESELEAMKARLGRGKKSKRRA